MCYGLTQDEFARLMNVSVRTVSGWETGDRPPKYGESILVEIENKLEVEERLEENDKPQSSNNTEKEESYRKECEKLRKELIASQRQVIELMKELQLLKYTDSVESKTTNKKYVAPDNIPYKLFDLLDKHRIFTNFSIGYSGGWDMEGNVEHKWLYDQMNLLDTQINEIRSMYLSDEVIEKIKIDNHKNVEFVPPSFRGETRRQKKQK
jgi:transcriptional regulator with XRE-family HTH domain